MGGGGEGAESGTLPEPHTCFRLTMCCAVLCCAAHVRVDVALCAFSWQRMWTCCCSTSPCPAVLSATVCRCGNVPWAGRPQLLSRVCWHGRALGSRRGGHVAAVAGLPRSCLCANRMRVAAALRWLPPGPTVFRFPPHAPTLKCAAPIVCCFVQPRSSSSPSRLQGEDQEDEAGGDPVPATPTFDLSDMGNDDSASATVAMTPGLLPPLDPAGVCPRGPLCSRAAQCLATRRCTPAVPRSIE